MENKQSAIFLAINNSALPFRELFKKYPQIKEISIFDIFNYLNYQIPEIEKINENLNKLKLKNFKYKDKTKQIFDFFVSINSKSNNEWHDILVETYTIQVIFINCFKFNITFNQFDDVLDMLPELNKKYRKELMIKEEKISYDVVRNGDLFKVIYESISVDDFLFVAGYEAPTLKLT